MNQPELRIRELDYNDYDFYYSDWKSYILPSLSTIWTSNFLSYCKNYSKVWDRLVHLPINVIDKDYYPSQNILEMINGIIMETVWKKLFYTEELESIDWNPVYTTELWLYLIYNAVIDIIWNMDELNFILRKLFTWFCISITPNCETWVLLREKIFIDENMDKYKDNIAHFRWDLFSHILLYKNLKANKYNPIEIKNYHILETSVETNNKNRNWKYTTTKHKKYSKHITEILNIQWCENIWDCFDVTTQENYYLILWYILFNEFILGNHITFCYWKFLWYKLRPAFDNYFIVNKDFLWDFIYNNSCVHSISLINHTYQDVYLKKIENLPIVKKLRTKLPKPSDSHKNNNDKQQDIQKWWQDEVIKEIDLIRTTTDISQVTVNIKHKEIHFLKTDFQVDDTKRLKEMRKLTRQNWWAHIERYDYGKKYIKWDRIKNIWNKKWKYDWNEYVY